MHELVAVRAAQVKIPAFTKGKSQLTDMRLNQLANWQIKEFMLTE